MLVAGNAAALRADAPVVPAPRPADASSSVIPQAGVVDLRAAIEYLASDELDGRGTGTAGQDKAADYIADVFARLKLEHPAGWDGYAQPFKVTTGISIDPATVLAAGGGKNWAEPLNKPALEVGKDYVPLPLSRDGEVTAGVAFAGYGITDKGRGYDDYAGLDVKGKIVLVLRYEPVRPGVVQEDHVVAWIPMRLTVPTMVSAFTGKKDDWSTNATFNRKLALAQERGAAALLVVNPPNFRKDDVLFDFATQGRHERAGLPAVQVTQPVANALLQAGGLGTVAELQKAIDDAKAPRSQPLAGVTAKLNVALKTEQKDVCNVAAVLPGKGPRAGEFVVVGAHYDHLGRGRGEGAFPMFAGQVHHGADDNASGTAAILKMAEHFATAGPQERSILFVAFTGEEWGLLGSKHFVNNPPAPLEKMTAMLNLDMVGRIRESKLQVGGGGTAAGFEKLLAGAADGLPLKLSTGSKGGLGPSDHMSFGLKKVPVLFFFSGLHADYHRPTDTADKVNYDGVRDVVALGQRVVAALTTMEKEPYVGKFDSQGMFAGLGGPATQPGAHGGGPMTGSPSGRARVSLGVIPDYDEDPSIKGVRIAGASEGSAAEKAGLRAGDVLTGWDEVRLNNLTDLMTRLSEGKPGDKVKITVRRDGRDVELEATLTERRG